MKKVAVKYGLDFKKLDKINALKYIKQEKRRRNIISGKLNGVEIVIYDYHIAFMGKGDYHRYTKFIKDGNKEDLGIISNEDINQLLNEIKNK